MFHIIKEEPYGNYRFLAYAVELFFTNGGSRAYIVRVAAENKETIAPSDFIGKDGGPGKRTGIQAFLDNKEVSVMAIPGVTEPKILAELIAHCEKTASRFAILD